VSAADEQPSGGGAAATPATDGRGPPLSQEFFLRVNDFIQMANRIEHRYDTHHAQLAFLHAFARYSGHHYRTTATVDNAANREAFAEYFGGCVKELIVGHLEDMAGAPAADAGAATLAADDVAAAPADEATPANHPTPTPTPGTE
jgi:hypothetical protein